MNFLVCTVFVFGSLAAGHTIRYKREIPQAIIRDNQIEQQEVAESSRIDDANYSSGTGLNQGGAAIAQSDGKISHITITKQIPIHQPVPVPVEVEKKVPYPMYVDVPVPVDQPYYVKIYRPYPVPVYKDIPFTVYKDVHVPVKVAVEVPYLVKVPVLVPHPIPIPIDVSVKVPVPDLKIIKKPIVLEHQERENGGGDYVGSIDVNVNRGIGHADEIAAPIDHVASSSNVDGRTSIAIDKSSGKQ